MGLQMIDNAVVYVNVMLFDDKDVGVALPIRVSSPQIAQKSVISGFKI